jgi:hypothetical protein
MNFGEHACHELRVLDARGSAVVGGGHHHRGGVSVQAHPQFVLDRVDRGGVHELEHRRPDLAGDRHDGTRGRLHGVERGDHRARDVLRRQQAQGHLGDHPERALTADEQLRQRQPGDIFEARAAESHRGAVGQHDLKAQHVVGW